MVFKKLGYYSELEDLDRNLCKLVNKMKGCNRKEAMVNILEGLNVDSRYCCFHKYYKVNYKEIAMEVGHDGYLVTEVIIIKDQLHSR